MTKRRFEGREVSIEELDLVAGGMNMAVLSAHAVAMPSALPNARMNLMGDPFATTSMLAAHPTTTTAAAHPAAAQQNPFGSIMQQGMSMLQQLAKGGGQQGGGGQGGGGQQKGGGQQGEKEEGEGKEGAEGNEGGNENDFGGNDLGGGDFDMGGFE